MTMTRSRIRLRGGPVVTPPAGRAGRPQGGGEGPGFGKNRGFPRQEKEVIAS